MIIVHSMSKPLNYFVEVNLQELYKIAFQPFTSIVHNFFRGLKVFKIRNFLWNCANISSVAYA